MSVVPAAALGRREVNKARVRQRLIEAALDLFAEQGYDATTVEDITTRAGASPRTFFRYFSSKERVLFFGREDFFAAVEQRISGRGDVDLAAMLETFVELAPDIELLADRIRRYRLAIASSVTLRGRDRDAIDDVASRLAAALASRGGRTKIGADDELLAAIALLAFDRAVTRWLAAPPRRRLGPFITAEFARLERVVRPHGPGRVA